MNHYVDLSSAAQRPALRASAGYRVTARRRDYSVLLVRLAENPRQAANYAQAACDELRAGIGRDDIVAVRTEEWVGTLTAGEWRPTSRWQSVFARRFAARNGAHDEASRPSLPRTGDTVECVLLAAKTRKGGWKAKLVAREVEGPVTNTVDVPATVQPGQVVQLRVGAISQDGQRVQFHWRS